MYPDRSYLRPLVLALALALPVALLARAAAPVNTPAPQKQGPASAEEPSHLRRLLADPIVALFVVLAVGLLVGRVQVRGVSLGMLGIFAAGVPLGALGCRTPDHITTLGAIFLLYGIGLGAGPTFFRSLGAVGKPLLLVLAVMVATAALTTAAFAWAAGVPADLAVGVFTGAMKSSSGFASALDRLPDRASAVAVGYALAYPLSLFAIVLFAQLAPRLFRVDLAEQNRRLAERQPARRPTARAMVELANPAVAGRRVSELTLVRDLSCRVVGTLEGDRLVRVAFDWVCPAGAHVLVVGPADTLPTVVGYLGRPCAHRGLVDMDERQAEVVLTSPRLADRALGELNPLGRYGVQVLAVTRLGHEIVPSADLVLQPLDVLQVSGPPANVDEFAEAAGHRPRALQQTDLLSLAVGIAVGVVIGQVPIGWADGVHFLLGTAGGPMVVALLLSSFGRVGGIVGHFPPATQLFLVRLGLGLLLAGAAVQAGGEVAAVWGRTGPTLVLMAATVTVTTLTAGLLTSRFGVRHNLLETLAVLCGGLNATPAYEQLSRQADAPAVLTLFSTSYAIAMILTVFVTQVLIAALRLL